MDDWNLKKFITWPYKLTLKSLNLLQDKISRQPKPEMYEDIKIKDETKLERMTFEELVMSRGFPLEIHYVDTEDGFILKLYRIPGGKEEINFRKKQKQSIFLMHGIFDSSDGWVSNSEDKCIPFILANLGFDVWLGNSRGNKHSRHHKVYKDDSYEMWNFSFHEMGMYDLPAFLEHITKINDWSSKVIYIGHSQGTSQLFSALTQKLEYFQSKIKLFIALGPVARVCNMNSKLLNFLKILQLDKICAQLSFWEIFSHDIQLQKFSSWVMPKIPYLCFLVNNLICDVNSGNCNNRKYMPVYLSHQPGGGSLQSISHYVQMSRSGKFRKYDFGQEINNKVYNSNEPPEYDLNVIKDFPIALISGVEDKLSNPVDVKWLKDELGDNIVMDKLYDGMGHSTFMMADNMEWFNEIIELIDLYS